MQLPFPRRPSSEPDTCDVLAVPLHVVAVAVGEPRPALAGQALHAADPARVELAAEIVVEEVLAVDAAALGHAQHLALERQQTAVEAVELVDERSEEHTSELQSLMRISYAVFCLKKKTIN